MFKLFFCRYLSSKTYSNHPLQNRIFASIMTAQRDILKQQILQVDTDQFDQLALQVFRYQATYNPLYKKYLSLIQVQPAEVQSIKDIPFLPISFFKTHEVKTVHDSRSTVQGGQTAIFSSSGTTGSTTSQHFVKDVDFYLANTVKGFVPFYGAVTDYCVLGLLPSYLERSGSSLIAMVDHFIKLSKYSQSGFFLYDHDRLAEVLRQNKKTNIPTLLIGVSFALLDFAEQYTLDLEGVIIMETGGMKGRRKEITRAELHQILQKSFNTKVIHSEYGMTELLSQGYSKGAGIFYPSPTMKILAREVTDPFAYQKHQKTGVLNIIDLANLDSCAFIATDDLGRIHEDGSFEILGRLDSSDIRGCNLMVA